VKGARGHAPGFLAEPSRLARADRTVVVVDFTERHGWRPHPFLRDLFRGSGADPMSLDPEPIVIDGALFDPVRHFRGWRRFGHAHAASKPERRAILQEALGEATALGGTRAEAADRLNAEGYRKLTGKPWTAETARKFAGLLREGGLPRRPPAR
jgi:hypothetical protein